MRVLFITNYYPPSVKGGGYMQLCQEVAEGLAGCGHAVAVLTSGDAAAAAYGPDYPVYRDLTIDPDWYSRRPAALQFVWGRRARERAAIQGLTRAVHEFGPDVIFVWHAIGLSRALLAEAEHQDGIPTVYYLANYLPALPDEYAVYWTNPPVHPLARIFKRPAAHLALGVLAREGKPVQLRYANVICVSEYVRRRLVSEGLIPSTAVVIYNGVDLGMFSASLSKRPPITRESVRCIFAGRLMPEKGVHTAIAALAHLKREGNLGNVTLDIYGSGPAGYVDQLTTATLGYDLSTVVTFHSPVPRDELPALLGQRNVLLLPSEWDEPLARSMQEGMAMGLLVIGTPTGGSPELLVDGDTGLIFRAGDAQSLASRLRWVVEHPQDAELIAQRGRAAVARDFTIQLTIERIERYLEDLLARRETVSLLPNAAFPAAA